MVKYSSPRPRAFLHTTATIPAFIRMQQDWRLPFFRAWDKYIHLAYIDTNVTPIADFRIEYDRPCVRGQIGNGIRFLRHTNLLHFRD
jgi:hypothetical protein